MHSTQNERINQITFSTLIIGVDIAKFRHVARAQDFRGVEFGKPITFGNNREGFELFVSWFKKIATEQGFKDAIVGMEPTGHYWLNLAHFLKDKQVKYGVVNPLHVKKSKELDNNSPTKNDIKDAKVIAQLVKARLILSVLSTKSIKKSLRKMKSFTPLSVSMRIFDNPTDDNKALSKYVDQYVSWLTI